MTTSLPLSRAALCAAVAAAVLLTACGKKEAAPASAAQAAASAKQPFDPLGPKVLEDIPPLAAGASQFKCILDPVNYQLDLSNMGRNAVVSLPRIGALQIASDALLLDAASAEDASARIMLAKPEYKRVPPKCAPYALSTRDVKLDQSTPVSLYKVLDGGRDMAYLYYAVSQAKPSYPLVAKQLFSEYSAEADTFKREELLKKITTVIDSNIKDADGKRLLMFEFEGKLSHYDTASKSFPVALERFNIGPSSFVSWRRDSADKPDTGSYRLSFDMGNHKDLNYVLADETAARALEGKVTERAAAAHSAYAPVAIRAYGQAVKAAEEGENKMIMVRLVQIDVLERDTLHKDGDLTPLLSINLR
ncbi:MAG: hypothetical protein ACJ8GW_03935 [Massilia sp.]